MTKARKRCSMCRKPIFAAVNGEWLCQKHFEYKLKALAELIRIMASDPKLRDIVIGHRKP